MPLTPDHIQKLWISQQQLANPLYKYMTVDQQQSYNQQLASDYQSMQNTILTKNSSVPISTIVSSVVNDNSNRAPFKGPDGTTSHGAINITPGPEAPNIIEVYDTVHNQVLFWSQNTRYILQIWYTDISPLNPNNKIITFVNNKGAYSLGYVNPQSSVVNAGTPVVGEILPGDFLTGYGGTNDPINLAQIMFANMFKVVQIDAQTIYWFATFTPFQMFELKLGMGGFWAVNPNFQNILPNVQFIISMLDSGGFDPLHPENINPGFSLVKATQEDSNTIFFRNQGGAVIITPEVHLIFIGDPTVWAELYNPNGDYYYGTVKIYIEQFVGDFLDSSTGITNLLHQYGIVGSSGVLDSIVVSVPLVINRHWLKEKFQELIDNGTISEPNSNSLYVCVLQDNIFTDGIDGWGGSHNSFITRAGNHFRYTMTHFVSNPDSAFNDIFMQFYEGFITFDLTVQMVNAITDPDGNAWNNGSGYELAYDIPYPTNPPKTITGPHGLNWSTPAIWDQYHNTFSYKAASPIPLVNSPAYTYFSAFYWTYVLENIDFNIKVIRNPSNNTYEILGGANIDQILSLKEWENLYILPYKFNLKTEIVNQDLQKVPISSINELLDIDIFKGKTNIVIASSQNVILTNPETPTQVTNLDYNYIFLKELTDPNDLSRGNSWIYSFYDPFGGSNIGWNLLSIGDSWFFHDDQIYYSVSRRPKTLLVNNKRINQDFIIDTLDTNGNVLSSYGADFHLINPYDPDMAFPGQYLVQEIKHPNGHVMWVRLIDKSAPSGYLLYHLVNPATNRWDLVSNMIGGVGVNFGRAPSYDEINNITLFNPYWSQEVVPLPSPNPNVPTSSGIGYKWTISYSPDTNYAYYIFAYETEIGLYLRRGLLAPYVANENVYYPYFGWVFQPMGYISYDQTDIDGTFDSWVTKSNYVEIDLVTNATLDQSVSSIPDYYQITAPIGRYNFDYWNNYWWKEGKDGPRKVAPFYYDEPLPVGLLGFHDVNDLLAFYNNLEVISQTSTTLILRTYDDFWRMSFDLMWVWDPNIKMPIKTVQSGSPSQGTFGNVQGGWVGHFMYLVGDQVRIPATPTDYTLVTHIEEDWSMNCDNGASLTTKMTLSDGSHCTFNLGTGLTESFYNSSNILIGSKTIQSGNSITFNQTISWTQNMSVLQGVWDFEIYNGASSDFGVFELDLKKTTIITNFSGYTPYLTPVHSGTIYNLRINEVRYYNKDGIVIARDTTPKVII